MCQLSTHSIVKWGQGLETGARGRRDLCLVFASCWLLVPDRASPSKPFGASIDSWHGHSLLLALLGQAPLCKHKAGSPCLPSREGSFPRLPDANCAEPLLLFPRFPEAAVASCRQHSCCIVFCMPETFEQFFFLIKFFLLKCLLWILSGLRQRWTTTAYIYIHYLF